MRAAEDCGGKHLRNCVCHPASSRDLQSSIRLLFPSFRFRLVDVHLAPSRKLIYKFSFNSGIMHRRRGGKIFSLSRHIQVRTTATATKHAVSACTLCQHARLLHTTTRCLLQVSVRPSSWDVPNSRPKAPPSPLTTSASAGLGKWAPPISRWAKPEPREPQVKTDSQSRPFLQRRNPQASPSPNRGLRSKPSVSFFEPRGASAPGKWSRPQGLTTRDSVPSTSTRSVVDEPMTGPSRGLQPNERFGSAGPRRELGSNGGQPFRSFIRSLDVENTPRQNRRWEGNGKYKSRGSLLFRRGDDIIPDQPKAQHAKVAAKPKVQKAKKSLRVNPDINIPSTVSVGNFARLLNVSLGKVFGLLG